MEECPVNLVTSFRIKIDHIGNVIDADGMKTVPWFLESRDVYGVDTP